MARERYTRTGKAQMVTTTATLGDKFYSLQFFVGFEGKSQNGWLIFGYDSADLYLLHLPHLLQRFSEIGDGPFLNFSQGEPCNN